jgi:predicted DNA-binding transcriptional regulator YafY
MGGKAKPKTLETLQFSLEILKRIPRTHKVSAPELTQQLRDAGWQRDLRTVQRQLDELTRHFEDIERDDRSKPYGYRWKEQAKGLTLPGLTEKESLLLSLAEQHLSNLMPAEVLRSLQPFFEQARANLGPYNKGGKAAISAKEWMQKVRSVSTTQPLLPPPIRSGVFEAVSSALYRNLWLNVDYQNAANRQTSARVMPLGLAQQGTRLYLVCRFEGYDNERSLAVNRIHAAEVTAISFERPAEFDLEKFDNDGRFGFGSGKRIRLEILIDKLTGVHLLESRLSEDQRVEEEGQRLRITATVADTEQLKWWLRGFGDAVEVIAPRQLAAAI